MVKKPDLMILTGPTAAGKTALSLRIAEELGGSIISADSMQVYKGLDIGSAKIRKEEMRGIPHYLLNVLEPEEHFDVWRFQQMAKEAMQEIYAKGRLPILTGGTGFYIQAVLRDVSFDENEIAEKERERLFDIARKDGPDVLFRQLQEVDPVSAGIIHPHNIRRVVRALEYYTVTGKPISEHNASQRMKRSPYSFRYFVLTDERKKLYDRIDRRVDEMIRKGLEEEVRGLLNRGLTEENTSMKGIGYREWFPYFRGEQSKEETIRLIKQNTRHFAKRQLTWFRREEDVIWLNRELYGTEDDRILSDILKMWEEREK